MKFKVSSRITISLSTDVEAESAEEAILLAYNRSLPAIQDDGDPDETWVTSGELDGSPEDLEAMKF